MAGIFEEPFISEIDRDAILQRGAIKSTPRPKVPKEEYAEVSEIVDELTAEGLSIRSPWAKLLISKLDKLIRKADKVAREAGILQKMQLTALNRDLRNAPRYIIDMANDLTYVAPRIGYSNGVDYPADWPTEVCLKDVECWAALAGMTGNDMDQQIHAKLDEVAAAVDQFEAIESDIKQSMDSKPTGWQMFIFMVRFILAYAVHMIFGFLCCYFVGMMRLGIKVLGKKIIIIDLGNVLSKIFGNIERALKSVLGFPCNVDDKDCVDLMGKPLKKTFSPFKCCRDGANKIGGNTSCKPSKSGVYEPPEKRLLECLTAAMDEFLNGELGDGGKPCRLCTSAPKHKTPRSEAIAKALMDYLVGKSQIQDSQGNNPYNKLRTIRQNTTKSLGVVIDTANASKASGQRLKSALGLNFEYARNNENASLCDNLEALGGMAGILNKDLGNIKEEDLMNAMLANLDDDISQFLNKEKRTKIEIDATSIEPFKTIADSVKAMDKYLGDILDSARKLVSNVKAFTGILSSDKFCCIIFTIAFIINIVRYHKLCPEEDVKELYSFAADFRGNKAIEDMLKWLELIKEIIEALNTELIESIEMSGIGLPLGTLVEILKHIVGNVVAALFAMAVAPIDKALTELANSPLLKELLDRNCFGVSGLLGMIQCGIKWLLDLIKELAAGLVNISASNIELLGDIRIGNLRMAFLDNLLKLIQLLIDLLMSIGDCTDPEVLAREIAKKGPEILPAQVADYVNRAKEAGVSLKDLDNIGDEDPDMPGTSIDDAIDEIQEIDSPLPRAVFQILPADLGFFEEVVREVNSISLQSIVLKDGTVLGKVDFEEEKDLVIRGEDIEDMSGIPFKREETLSNLLNMVESLKSLKKENIL